MQVRQMDDCAHCLQAGGTSTDKAAGHDR
jgi:hypothetical protein